MTIAECKTEECVLDGEKYYTDVINSFCMELYWNIYIELYQWNITPVLIIPTTVIYKELGVLTVCE